MPSTPSSLPAPAVAALLTPARFGPYLSTCGGDVTAALALYQWNSEIAAAFFQSLGHLEVMLRNTMDARLVARQQRAGRTTEWYDDPAVPISPKARADVRAAHQRAQIRGAATPRGKIVAELGFGFWRFLITRQYTSTLWPDLASAFPYAPNRALTTIEDPVRRLHKLRNRIAHHEAVWQLALEDRRDDLRAILGYIDPAACAWVITGCRIDDVLTRRP